MRILRIMMVVGVEGEVGRGRRLRGVGVGRYVLSEVLSWYLGCVLTGVVAGTGWGALGGLPAGLASPPSCLCEARDESCWRFTTEINEEQDDDDI